MLAIRQWKPCCRWTQLDSLDEVKDEITKLRKHFQKYPAIESSCYIPLNAASLILVYLEHNRTRPTTHYELLYQLMHRSSVELKASIEPLMVSNSAGKSGYVIFDDGTLENARRPMVIHVEGALGSGKS